MVPMKKMIALVLSALLLSSCLQKPPPTTPVLAPFILKYGKPAITSDEKPKIKDSIYTMTFDFLPKEKSWIIVKLYWTQGMKEWKVESVHDYSSGQ